MSNARQSHIMWRLKPWKTILIFGALLCVIYAFGSFTFDYYAGTATERFGVMGEVSGVGMFFIYILSYFIVLVVVLPILIIKRFGVGLAVYFLPYAIAGLFVEYYMEWVVARTLVSLWAVVGWCVIGLATGLSADLAYKFLTSRFSERLRAISTGVVLGLTTFILVLVALRFFYMEYQIGLGSFLGVAYYGLPFLIVSSGFGGYTAYAISRNV